MVLTDSPEACILRAKAELDESRAFGRPTAWPREPAGPFWGPLTFEFPMFFQSDARYIVAIQRCILSIIFNRASCMEVIR